MSDVEFFEERQDEYKSPVRSKTTSPSYNLPLKTGQKTMHILGVVCGLLIIYSIVSAVISFRSSKDPIDPREVQREEMENKIIR